MNRIIKNIKRLGKPKLGKYLPGFLHVLPDFIIFGAQRCGTTALYSDLTKHPSISSSLVKEVHFFDRSYRFKNGVSWYRKHFPLISEKYYSQLRYKKFITGEATPSYLFYPRAAKRIKEVIPNVRLIALLRDPVDRAYSHYWHVIRRGLDNLSFQEAVKAEKVRLTEELEKINSDDCYDSDTYHRRSYLSRSTYASQLKIWKELFPGEQMLILKSEEYFENPTSVFNKVIDFLNLPPWCPKKGFIESGPKSAGYPKMDSKLRKELIDYFAPRNEELYNLLGVNFGWERSK